MPTSAHQKAVRNAIDRAGKSVTMTHYTLGTEDDHGDRPRSSTAGSPYTVTAVVSWPTEPTVVRSAAGEEIQSDARATIRDDADGVGELKQGGDDAPASELTVDGDTYRVVRSVDRDNGVLALEMVMV